MRRTFAKISMMALMAAASFNIFWACDEEPQPEQYDTVGDVIEIAGEYPVPHPEIPMTIFNMDVKSSPDGVSVEVIDVTETNFKFVCRPGENVASYRVDVYPLAILYNYMLEEGGVGASAQKVEKIIVSHLFNTSGSG